jgi:hypothetical protein
MVYATFETPTQYFLSISLHPMALLMKPSTFIFKSISGQCTSPVQLASHITSLEVVPCSKFCISAWCTVVLQKEAVPLPLWQIGVQINSSRWRGSWTPLLPSLYSIYKNCVSFRMGPPHHCPSYTSDSHFSKARTLADVAVDMVGVEDCFPLRKVLSDVIYAAFTMDLHWATEVI